MKTIFAFIFLFSQQLFSHQSSDSYLNIIKSQKVNTISLSIAIRDLEYAVGLDMDANNKITWGEVLQRRVAIESYILSRLSLYSVKNEKKFLCDLNSNDLLVDDKADGSYLVFNITSPCLADMFESLSDNSFVASTGEIFFIDYQLFFDIDENHRGLMLLQTEGNVATQVASPENHLFKLRNEAATVLMVLSRYIKEGVWHILIGVDHILFLLVLLLPSVLVYKNNIWQQRENVYSCLVPILKIVTAFTLAHSITLSLSVLKIVQLPSHWVEIIIAFTVLLTCFYILKPVFKLPLWKLAFVFGLIHGFGFANVLLDLGLEETVLALSLLGFNLGVELGQLFIVLIFILFAFVTHRYWWYKVFIFKGGISLTAIISCIWIIERTFNYELLGF